MYVYTCSILSILIFSPFLGVFFRRSNTFPTKSTINFKIFFQKCGVVILNSKKYMWILQHVGVWAPWVCDRCVIEILMVVIHVNVLLVHPLCAWGLTFFFHSKFHLLVYVGPTKNYHERWMSKVISKASRMFFVHVHLKGIILLSIYKWSECLYTLYL